MYRGISVCILSAIAMTACGKKSSDKQPSAHEETDKTSQGAGVLNITSTDQALKFVQAALASTAEVSSEMAATKAGSIAISFNEQNDPNCYDGTPRNDNEEVFIMPGASEDRIGEVNERAPYYASGLWYCHMKNVIPEIFETSSVITCAVGDISYDGSVTDQPMTIDTAASGCFVGKDEVPPTLNVLVTASKIDSSKYGFDHQLTLKILGDIPEENSNINVRMKITDKEIAVATWNEREEKKSGAAARLDTETGTIRFAELENTFSEQSKEDEDRVRNTRMFVKGDLDDKGKFKVITHMEGAKGEIFIRKSRTGYATRFVSMAGNVADGVKTKNYGAPLGETTKGTIVPLSAIPDLDYYDYPNGVNSSGELRQVPHPGCFGEQGATCENNSGIPLTQENYQKYLMFPKEQFAASTTHVDPLQWVQTSAAYLTFEAGALSDIFSK